jgi:hypothetical protein
VGRTVIIAVGALLGEDLMLLRATVTRIADHMQPRMLLRRQTRPGELLRLISPEADVHAEQAAVALNLGHADQEIPTTAVGASAPRRQTLFKLAGPQRSGLAARLAEHPEPITAASYLRQLVDKSVELQIVEELHSQSARLVRKAPGQTQTSTGQADSPNLS